MRLLLLTLCVTILTGCGCEYHLRKARAKCGVTTETITVHDTITVNSVSTDTLFKFYHTQKDTTIIREGRLTMKYYYNTKDSTVFLSGKCDTIRVPYEKTIIKNNYHESIGKWYWFLIILVGLIFVILLRKL